MQSREISTGKQSDLVELILFSACSGAGDMDSNTFSPYACWMDQPAPAVRFFEPASSNHPAFPVYLHKYFNMFFFNKA